MLLAGGVGATMVGATSIGLSIGALKIAQRVAGGAVAGVGTAGLMESLARKSQKKQAGKKNEEIFDEFDVIDERNEFRGNMNEKANWETKFKTFEDKLDDEINGYAESLKNERGSVNMRALVGLGVGAFVISGTPGYLLKWGIGMDSSHGNFHWLSDKLGITKPNINVSSTIGSGGASSEILTEIPERPSIPPGGSPADLPPNSSGLKLEQTPEAPKNSAIEKVVSGSVEKTSAGVEVKSGTFSHNVVQDDNVERIIIHQKLEEGMSRPEANKLAHLIATNPKNLESIEKLKLIHAGDKVIVDWENGTVKVDRLSGIKGHSHSTGATEIHKPKLADINPTEHAPQEKIIPVNPLEAQSNMPSGGQTLREAALRDEAMQQSENSTNLTPEEQLKYQKIAGANSELIQKNIISMPKFAQAYGGDMLEVEKLRMLAHNGTAEAIAYENSYTELVKKMSQAIFTGNQTGESLDSLKNANADDYWKNDGKLNPKLIQLKAYVARKFGEKISNPRIDGIPPETVSKWAHRLAFKSLEAGGMKLESFVKLKTH